MKKNIDFDKPIYINSFNAHEIIFNRIRGENVSLGRNETNISMSLDVIEIWKQLEKGYKESFPDAVKTVRIKKAKKVYEYRTFMDALINVDFSDELVLDRINAQVADLEILYGGGRRYNIKDKYKNLLDEIANNKNCWKKYYEKNKEDESETTVGNNWEAVNNSYKECCRLYKDLVGSMTNVMAEIKELPKGWTSEKKLRVLLYLDGFDAALPDGTTKHFVLYKRSASKAKDGSCLFIWDELYQYMEKEWTWMDLPIEQDVSEPVDLTSYRAYEALTLSSIISTFKLQPKNILLIESAKGNKIAGNRRIACLDSGDNGAQLVIRTPEECKKCPLGNKQCRNEILNEGNKIWDGQALLDESVFDELFQENEPHGMILLRNKFFKGCAFNTRIQAYYAQNSIETVKDMFGQRHSTKDIKLIITPDCVKFLKFSDVFWGEAKKKDRDKKAYKYWIKNLSEFGIVKTDKPGNRGGRHKVGYQILNTLPFTQDDIEKIVDREKKNFEKLYADHNEFMKIIPKDVAKGRLVYELLKYNPDVFCKTQMFRKYRTEEMATLRRRIQCGELMLKGDMYTLCSMPFEMLKFSAFPDEEINPVLGPDEAYILGEKDDNVITLCRYPHLSSGSVAVLKNRQCKEYEEWFNLKDSKNDSNIVIISPWDSNIMVKLGGADFDSDTVLYIRDEIVQGAASKFLDAENRLFSPLSPEYGVGKDGLAVAQAGAILKGDASGRNNDNLEKALLDHELSHSQRRIGGISNQIQLFNSYLMEELMKKGSRDSDYLKLIYECVLKLSVLNELEIDSAKHSLAIRTGTQKTLINDTCYNGDYVIKREKVADDLDNNKNMEYFYYPSFFYNVQRYKKGKVDALLRKEKYWECPLDQISEKISKIRKSRETEIEEIEMSVLFEEPDPADKQPNQRQIKNIERCLEETIKQLIRLDKRASTAIEKFEERNRIQKDFVDEIVKKQINRNTMRYVIEHIVCIKKTVGKQKLNQRYFNSFLYFNQSRALGLLFMAGERMEENVVLSCLKKQE